MKLGAKKARTTKEAHVLANGKNRLSVVLNALVPNRYVASIYLIFIFFLAIYAFRVSHDLSEEAKVSKALNFISYERYTGLTEGEIVLVDEAGSHSERSKLIYKGRKYKVFVVYSLYHKADPHFIKEYTHIGKYSQSYQMVSIDGAKINGPSIICIGRNRYAFIDAPSVERVGFLNLTRIEKNKISIKGSWASDLDTRFYSTDCEPPDKAIIEQLSAVFKVRLPVAPPSGN